MSQKVSVIVSDAHLGAVPARNEALFRRFLSELPALTDDLIIAGDLFDFWFEYRSVVPNRHFATLRLLSEIADRGVRIRLVGGNHDAWGGDYLRQEVGLELLDGPARIDLRGHRTLLAHGDGMGGGDRGYKLLRAVTRSRPGRWAFRTLHPDLGIPLARRVSHTDRRHHAGPGAEAPRAHRLADHARRLLEDDPTLDLVICGHTHVPQRIEVEPGRYYLNVGDWIHHFTYGVVSPGSVELRRWERAQSARGDGWARP